MPLVITKRYSAFTTNRMVSDYWSGLVGNFFFWFLLSKIYPLQRPEQANDEISMNDAFCRRIALIWDHRAIVEFYQVRNTSRSPL